MPEHLYRDACYCTRATNCPNGYWQVFCHDKRIHPLLCIVGIFISPCICYYSSRRKALAGGRFHLCSRWSAVQIIRVFFLLLGSYSFSTISHQCHCPLWNRVILTAIRQQPYQSLRHGQEHGYRLFNR